MKKATIYARVSTPDQDLETQLYDLRKPAAERGFEVAREYCDRGISGSKAKRPGLDAMLADSRRGEFSVVLVAAFDRFARSAKIFLEIVDEPRESSWILYNSRLEFPALTVFVGDETSSGAECQKPNMSRFVP